MAKISISLPDELFIKMKMAQGKYQSLSGFCAEVIEKGIMLKEKENLAREAELSNK